jgi:hypothetical protein
MNRLYSGAKLSIVGVLERARGGFNRDGGFSVWCRADVGAAFVADVILNVLALLRLLRDLFFRD